MKSPLVHPLATERTSTGIAGLDPLLDGGFPANRAVLLCGAAGTGKTTFGLQFLLAGLQAGEAGALVSVDAKPQHIVDDARAVGLSLDAGIDAGTLEILDASPYFTATRGRRWARPGIDAREVAADLVQQMRRIAARRLVIDSVTSLVPPEMGRTQADDYLRSLVQSIEDNLGCTILLTCRGSRQDPQSTCEAARYLVSGVLELHLERSGGSFTRKLRIRKMRGTAVLPADYRLDMEPGSGLSVAPRHEASQFTLRPRRVAAAQPQPSDRPAAV